MVTISWGWAWTSPTFDCLAEVCSTLCPAVQVEHDGHACTCVWNTRLHYLHCVCSEHCITTQLECHSWRLSDGEHDRKLEQERARAQSAQNSERIGRSINGLCGELRKRGWNSNKEHMNGTILCGSWRCGHDYVSSGELRSGPVSAWWQWYSWWVGPLFV